ncbi:MAG: hypothetical protein Kow0063_09800 [Anaerolineae bacterium]
MQGAIDDAHILAWAELMRWLISGAIVPQLTLYQPDRIICQGNGVTIKGNEATQARRPLQLRQACYFKIDPGK